MNRWCRSTGTYYQYANRLATLWFLREQGVGAQLISVYFVADRFPDGTPCPSSRAQWLALIKARRLTLGLAKQVAFAAFEQPRIPAASVQLTSKRDPARSYGQIDVVDLERLGLIADADLDAFFVRNPAAPGLARSGRGHSPISR